MKKLFSNFLVIAIAIFLAIFLGALIPYSLYQAYFIKQVNTNIEIIANVLDYSKQGCESETDFPLGGTKFHCNINEDYSFKFDTGSIKLNVEDSKDDHYLLITKMNKGEWTTEDFGYIVVRDISGSKIFNKLEVVEYNLMAGSYRRELPLDLTYVFPSKFLSNGEDFDLFVPSKRFDENQSHRFKYNIAQYQRFSQ